MINSDFDDELELPKDTPMAGMIREDLSVHSVEVLKQRLVALKAEIGRTEQAIVDKGDARQSAEGFFK